MKKIAIVFGGSYKRFAKLFPNTRKIKAKNAKFRFFVCFGPRKSKVLAEQTFYLKKREKKIPQTADEVSKEIKKYDPDAVLFLGTCGNLNGKINKAFYPNQFSFVEIKKIFPAEKYKPQNKTMLENILGTDKSKVLTLSTFVTHWHFGPKEKEGYMKIWPDVLSFLKKKGMATAKMKGREIAESFCEFHYAEFLDHLKKYAQLIEMESWKIVSELRKYPIGVMLFSSDSPKDTEVYENIKKQINWKKFRKYCLSAIAKITN
jgi:nucleoside phosphorylase